MKKPKIAKNLFPDLLDLLLPRTCCCCDRALRRWEKEICNYCLTELPVTRFENDPDNLVAKVFWGRVFLEQAVSWFFFLKGSRFQEAIHRLKYQNRPEIGFALGEEFGYQLLHSSIFKIPEILVPVPLHPLKLKQRGYNQSEIIAKGLSSALGIPLQNDVLFKKEATVTQTDKSRFDRYLNVSGSFGLSAGSVLKNKHVFLIDDVLTTGATLEACASILLEVPGVRVSAGTLAWAMD